MKYIDCISNSISDHKILIAELSFLETFKKSKFKKNSDWKLNEQILENEIVNRFILNKCSDIPMLIYHHQKEWYEFFIREIIDFLKIQSRKINNERKRYICNLFIHLNNIGFTNFEKREKIKTKIDEYYQQERQGIEKRACEAKRNFIFQPTKVLIEKEIKNSGKNFVKKFKKSNGEITEDQDEIITEVFDFYNQLLSVDRVEVSSINEYKFLFKPIKEVDKNIDIGYQITYAEAEKVVMKMKTSSPGPNGLTVGFYKKYFKYFGHFYIDILNNHQDKLTKTFTESKIKLIPKNKKEIKGVNDLRPISLTNIEYRIFTKILANRFRQVGHRIIHDHQTCSVFGRRMNDNIWLLNDLVEDSNSRNKKLNIILADQKKAFDSISHRYIFALLKHIDFGDFIFNNIKRIYTESTAKIVLNKFETIFINIRSGIKQGCALSMILYIIAIEELLLRIKLNGNIKGYKLIGLDEREIKATAYADDIVGYVSDTLSIQLFFQEFDEWGEISGASINRDKTVIIHINEKRSVEDFKVLGVFFNKKGISTINIKNVFEKIRRAIHIWDIPSLNMLDRITITKTFLLSKLWFIATFVKISKEKIKELNSMIFKFIWHSPIELIKRDTLILPYQDGGMSMFHLSARLKTIALQTYLYIRRNYQRDFYQLSIKWLKFQLRDLGLKNFNLLPYGGDEGLPEMYQVIIDSQNEFKEYDRNFTRKNLTSKMTYELFRKPYEKRSKRESEYIDINWTEVYNKINNKSLDSDLRVINYKILNEALSLNIKLYNTLGEKCIFCEKHTETRDHLFVECSFTKKMYEYVRPKLNNQNSCNKLEIIINFNLDEDDVKVISIFKMSIWSLRNLLKKRKNSNEKEIIFKNILFKKFLIYL